MPSSTPLTLKLVNAGHSADSSTLTKDGHVSVTGIAAGSSWEYTTDDGTTWRVGIGTSFVLADGSYAAGMVEARQTSATGTTDTLAGSLLVDSVAPAAALISALAPDGFVNAAEAAAGVTLSGTVEAGSTAAVTWGSTTKSATVNASGAWSVLFATEQVPSDGSTSVSVVATDAAGNVSAVSTKALAVDTSAPAAPTIGTVAGDDVVSVARSRAEFR